MYAQIFNNNITLFESLPFRIRLENGTTRTSLHELTNEQLLAIGIYPVTEIKPEYDPYTQYLDGPFSNLENGVIPF